MTGLGWLDHWVKVALEGWEHSLWVIWVFLCLLCSYGFNVVCLVDDPHVHVVPPMPPSEALLLELTSQLKADIEANQSEPYVVLKSAN